MKNENKTAADNATAVKEEIRNRVRAINTVLIDVAGLFAMRVSNMTLAVLMFLTFLYFIANEYRNPSAIYIMVMALVAPGLLGWVMKNRKPDMAKEDPNLPLPELRKKFRFSTFWYKMYSGSFFLILTMIALWHYSYIKRPAAFEPAAGIPMMTMLVYVALRVLLWGGTLLYFKIFPLKAFK